MDKSTRNWLTRQWKIYVIWILDSASQNYICQQGNILLDNLRVLDLVRMSRSHVKGHRRAGVCVLRMLLGLFVTPPRNRGGVIFSLQFVCVSVYVCVCVCVRLFSCEQNSSRTNAPIWMQFLLNSCLWQWLGPYWNWWPWVKGQGHCDRKCI